MRAARVLAQAKINLYLRIGERDESGYHDLSTHFHRIDLADEVIVRVQERGRSLDVGGPRMPVSGLGPPEKNLAYRAAMEYASRTGWQFPKGFAIEVTKNIPVGAGLGGGSADAGAVLRALDALAPQRMDPDEFQTVAASLGADVPFLASDSLSATAVGRGDVFRALPDRNPAATVILLMPPFSVSTADAYRWLDDDRAVSTAPAPVRSAVPTRLDGKESPWTSAIGNDFEPIVEKRHPELLALRERLTELGARTARLAGSGSCVFGIFDYSAPDARDVEVDALVLVTRTSTRVVQVEVVE
jgi:4-diphosphocytidyl-2-C-methyl-D-erythritol kinase